MMIRTAPPAVPQPLERRAAAPAARRRALPAILFAIILLAGAVLRFHGLDWDDGRLLHPDERHIVDVLYNRITAPSLDTLLDPRHSTLNTRSVEPNPAPGQNPDRPRQFAYGSLPLFVTDLAAWIWGGIRGENWNAYYKVFRVGRFLTALLDVATIALTYALARRAYGTVTALLAAAFMALAIMPIQLAHFFVTDTWLTTFVTAALWAALAAATGGRPRAFALAGFLLGCAMATKGSVLLFGITIAVAAWLATRAASVGRERDLAGMAGRFGGYLAAAGGAAALAFLLFEPYAVLDPRTYLRDIGEQSTIVSGKFDVPFTRQYVGTIPLVYQAKNLLGWELGPLLGALTLSGLAFVCWRAVRRRGTADIILLSWVLPYLALLAFNEIKFMRYLLPALPPMLIFGASLLAEMGAFRARPARAVKDAAVATVGADGAGPAPPRPPILGGATRSASFLSPQSWGAGGASNGAARWRGLPWAPSALAAGVLLATALMSVAFSAIYGRPHTRVAASEWIYANVPAGAKLSAETWDDALPLPLGPGRTQADYRYEIIGFDLYNDVPGYNRSCQTSPEQVACRANNEGTFAYLAERLEQVDYVVLSSARLYGSIPRLPWRYPVQQQYYTLLFEGRLGFTPVYDGTSYPSLGPVGFDDRFMDETYLNYDHPRVTLFRKERQLSRDELRALFAPALERPLSPTRYPTARSPVLDRLVDRLPAVRDYAWNGAAAGNGVVAAILWLLLVEALGLLALPLALRLFRPFPDRGWGLSKPLGWLLVAYPVWLGASLRLTRFTLPALLLTLTLGLALAAAAAWRWRAPLRAILRGAGPAILLSEGLFLGAGAFFLLLRLRNPDLWHPYWGGEKPMELAHLNAILRSAHFPPYDPWFADGTINYYYWGQYLVAALIKLTGLPVEIAFNLAMPTLSALVAAAGFSVAGGLAGFALRSR
ncbi:MAG: DUF2298 domain-containing protein, partial [Chloroflexota bacterium]|nr:DUF2298 domain-containing protein [Chloroflexota bacterium]